MEAAIQSAIQRAPRPLKAGELEVRPGEFVALADGRPLDLTVRELELLTALVERARPDRHARGALPRGVGRALPQVGPLGGRLRRQAAPEARATPCPGRRFIHTHFGFGYRFAPEPDGTAC